MKIRYIIIFLMLLSGCSNTLLRHYRLSDEKRKFIVNDYEFEFLMRAFELHNKKGVNNFRFFIKTRSKDKISDKTINADIPLPWIDSVIFIDSIQNISNILKLDVDQELSKNTNPFFDHGRLYDSFHFGYIKFTNRPQRITLKFNLDIYNRNTLEKIESIPIEKELYLKEEKKLWIH